MKHRIIFLIALLCIPLHAAKIIGLVPLRNEELHVRSCLRGLAKYTDSIVVLDDASEDRTLEIVRSLVDECNIEKILCKKTWARAESNDRNILLEVGRQLGGTHFLVIDADELFTANCADNNMLRNKILELQPGESLFFHWIRLWKSVYKFRAKNIELKRFAFCDNGTAYYPPRIIHSYRVPDGLEGEQKDFGNYATHGLLHFQAVNWRNMQIRQAWYQCLSRILSPQKEPYKIAQYYKNSLEDNDTILARCPREWFAYDFFDENVYYQPDTWREQQIAGWMQQYGVEYFKDLGIWDIDWHFDITEK